MPCACADSHITYVGTDPPRCACNSAIGSSDREGARPPSRRSLGSRLIRPHARLAWTRDRDAGSALRRDRPRAVVVRERAAAERAHEARARPAPVPGQVPAAAGRGADPAATAPRAASCSIRSAAPARRSWRPSDSVATRWAATSRHSTRCSRTRRRACTTPARSRPGSQATLARAEELLASPAAPAGVPAYLAEWYGEDARRELLAYRARSSRTARGAGSPRSC